VLLQEIISQEFQEDNTFDSENSFFEYFAASQVLKNYDLTDEEIENGIVGGGADGGCDGIYVFLNNEPITSDQVTNLSATKGSTLTLAIIQAKKETGFGEDAIMKWKTTSSNLLDMSKDMNSYSQRYSDAVRDSFMLFRDAVTRLLRSQIKMQIVYYYVSLAADISPSVKQQAGELCDQIKTLYPLASVEVSLCGAEKLMELYNKDAEESVNITLADTPIALGRNDEYVALVNLKEYYKFITDKEDRLKTNYFEANVRDYQGRNAVNSCIAESLANSTGEDFWWLNNGVTILSEKISPVTTKEIVILNPEIVNGLQTSTEIYNFFSSNKDKLDSEKRNVLVRIIAPTSEESRDNIIFATNNQTNIPKSTLRVTDSIHLQIEMYFKARGLYYDRRKNYYRNQNKKPSDIIGVSFLAQCLISIFLRKPDFARARPSTLLTEDDTYEKLYSDKTDLAVYYKTAQIGRKVQLNLKKTPNYTSAVRGDILYYVLYGVIAKTLEKTDVAFSDFKDLDVDIITDDIIDEVKEKVYAKYIEKGGNARVVKNSTFVDDVDQTLGLK
jgi:hypothetical protein